MPLAPCYLTRLPTRPPARLPLTHAAHKGDCVEAGAHKCPAPAAPRPPHHLLWVDSAAVGRLQWSARGKGVFSCLFARLLMPVTSLWLSVVLLSSLHPFYPSVGVVDRRNRLAGRGDTQQLPTCTGCPAFSCDMAGPRGTPSATAASASSLPALQQGSGWGAVR